jgi:hypothetical protein
MSTATARARALGVSLDVLAGMKEETPHASTEADGKPSPKKGKVKK